MHALAANWYVFLIVAVVLAAVAITLQLRNLHKIAKFVTTTDPNPSRSLEDAFSGTFRRMIPVAILALLSGLSAILFVVGVIANLLGK